MIRLAFMEQFAAEHPARFRASVILSPADAITIADLLYELVYGPGPDADLASAADAAAADAAATTDNGR